MSEANLKARLGLDSKEFQAGMATAKGASLGFQASIANAGKSMRGFGSQMRDLKMSLLGPIAAAGAIAAVIVKTLDALAERSFNAIKSMAAIRSGNLSAGMDSLKDSIDRVAKEYERLDKVSKAADSAMDRQTKAARSLADAKRELAKAMAIAAVDPADEEGRKRVAGEFDETKDARAAMRRQDDLRTEQDRLARSAADKTQQAADTEEQIISAAARRMKALEQASNYDRLASEQARSGVTTKYAQERAQFYADEAKAMRKNADEAAKIQADLTRKQEDLRRGAAADLQASRQKEIEIEAAFTEEQARQLQKQNDAQTEAAKLAKEAADKRAEIERRAADIRTKGAEDVRTKADRDADRLSRVRGRLSDADSMARIGGMLGGAQPGLAVADKQLQVAREQLAIDKENRKLNERIATALERAYGGGEGV